MILQVNPQFHVWVPHMNDHGLVLFLIDYHIEEHLYWVVAMQKTGEIWTLENTKVRADTNQTIGRVVAKDFVPDRMPYPEGYEIHHGTCPTGWEGHEAP